MKKHILSYVLVFLVAFVLAPFAVLPVSAVGDTHATISAGGYDSYAIKNDGSLWRWGSYTLSPIKIMDSAVAVSAGWHHAMVIKSDGSLWDLGDMWPDRGSPVKVMDSVVSVSAGCNHTMAIKSDGSLWAWGRNIFGALGDGTTTDRDTPVKIMDSVVAVSADGCYAPGVGAD
jgi:alpha-tubulin suppressor-like RCC1 family protein